MSVAQPIEEERATGSPRARRRRPGWTVVAGKEFADHVTSVRFGVVLLVLAVVAIVAVNSAAGGIRDAAPDASGSPGLFLVLFTFSPQSVPSFLQFMSWIAPLLGVAFGFDAVNGERSEGTLPRLVSQPIYRDDVINGKFAAGLIAIAIALVALTMIVAGVGLLRLGIVPTWSEVARLAAWLILTLVYVAFWLGLATLCSIVVRRAATSAMVALGTWLVLVLFAELLVGIIADGLANVPAQATFEQQLHHAQVKDQLSRISPSALYGEATAAVLNPNIRAVGISAAVFDIRDVDFAISQPLGFTQSLLLAWPQTVALVALTVICFGAAYILFMNQEIRA